MGHLPNRFEVGRARLGTPGTVAIGTGRRHAEADIAVLGVGDDEVARLVGGGPDGGEFPVEGLFHGERLSRAENGGIDKTFLVEMGPEGEGVPVGGTPTRRHRQADGSDQRDRCEGRNARRQH